MKKKQNSKETDERRIGKQRNRQSGRQAEKRTNKKAEEQTNTKAENRQRTYKQRNRQADKRSSRTTLKQNSGQANNRQAEKQTKISRKAACLKCPESKTGVCDNVRNTVLQSRKPREYGVLRRENR